MKKKNDVYITDPSKPTLSPEVAKRVVAYLKNERICKKHPKYKIIKKPTADCIDCWKLWANKLEMKNLLNMK